MNENLGLEMGIGAIYLALLILIGFGYTYIRPKPIYKYFRLGFAVKLCGGIAFAMVYAFYYGYGDTFTYFQSAKILKQIVTEDPEYGFSLMLGNSDFFRAKEYLYSHYLVNYFNGSDTFTIVRIAAILSSVTFNSFWATTLLFATFAFLGQWKLFLTLIRRYPSNVKEMAIASFLIPSVAFWGSGIMKDSIVIGLLSFLIHYIDTFFFTDKKKLKFLIYIGICVYLIYLIKSYVLLAFIPSLLSWFYSRFSNKIKSYILRIIVLPVMILLLSISTAFSFVLLENIDSKFKTDQLLEQATVYQQNHYTKNRIEGTRSGYSLGSYNKSVIGLSSMILPSINVALFRPYLWEIGSSIMLFASIESHIYLLMLLLALIRFGFGNSIKVISNDSFLVMCLVFVLTFAFIVGFSSYNFGALSRYKIPCLPFFAVLLFMMNHKLKKVIAPRQLRKLSTT